MSLRECSSVELTVWLHECAQDDEEWAVEITAELATRGGEAPATEVRAWLEERLAKREAAGRRCPTEATEFSRIAPCRCGERTHQLKHGYTRGGALWKGHVCVCDAWQCDDCGRLLERRRDCCR